MNLNDFYPAIETACHAITPIYTPALASASESLGLTLQDAMVLIYVPTFEPAPVSPQILNIKSPYSAPSLYENILTNLYNKGYLKPGDESGFHITRSGMDAVKGILHAVYAAINSIQTLPVTEMMDLASRLKELSDACYTAPEPPGKWAILHSRRMDPGVGAPVMVRIDQFFTELSAYRDDAHLAAWQVYGCSGHAWDILTLLWVEKEMSLENINECLERRGNSLEHTRAAVENLITRGWLLSSKESYAISPMGAEIRMIAEETTNRYYYSPFKIFSDYELRITLDLINKHRRNIPLV